jgi:hypothetical protein
MQPPYRKRSSCHPFAITLFIVSVDVRHLELSSIYIHINCFNRSKLCLEFYLFRSTEFYIVRLYKIHLVIYCLEEFIIFFYEINLLKIRVRVL